MRLDPIIAALRRRCPSFENRFAGAAEWAGLTEDEAPALPAAYVVLSWQQDPPAEYSEIVYSGGQVLYMDDARLAFQFEFSFETYLDLSDTWQGVDLDELGPLEGADIRVDCVEPSTKKNQPDNQIEATLKVNL